MTFSVNKIYKKKNYAGTEPGNDTMEEKMNKFNAEMENTYFLSHYKNTKGEKVVFSRKLDGILSLTKSFTFSAPYLVEELEIDGVEFPESVFCNLENLRKLTVRNTTIPNGSFSYKGELSEIELDNVIIGHEAFWMCPKITKVSLEKVKSVRNDSFMFRTLSDFTEPTEGLVIYDNWVVGFKTFSGDESSIIIDEDIKGIAGDAFEGSCVEEVIVKSKSISIGPKAFRESNLKKISFKHKNAVKFIGHGAFEKTDLVKFDCMSFDVEVETGIFASCRVLEEVVWPARTLPERTFIHCSQLRNLDIRNIHEIGKLALAYCMNMAALDIPDSVTSIGEYAFADMGDVSLKLPQNAVIGFRALNHTVPLAETKDGNEVINGWLYKSHFSKTRRGGHVDRVTLQDYIIGILPGAFGGITIDDLYLAPNTTVICPEALKDTHLRRLHGTLALNAVSAELFRECPELEDIDVYDSTVYIEGFSNTRKR